MYISSEDAECRWASCLNEFFLRNVQSYESNVLIDSLNILKDNFVKALSTWLRRSTLFVAGAHTSAYGDNPSCEIDG